MLFWFFIGWVRIENFFWGKISKLLIVALTVLKNTFFALKLSLVDSFEEDLTSLEAQFFLFHNRVTSSSGTPCLFNTENNWVQCSVV